MNLPKNTTDNKEKEMSKKEEKAILYSICIYMIENKEKFKNYKIYEDILKDAKLPNYKDISQDNDANELYHTLLNTYKFLTGVSVYKENKDPCTPLGYDVMPCIDAQNADEIAQELIRKLERDLPIEIAEEQASKMALQMGRKIIQEMSYWVAVCYDYFYLYKGSGDGLKQYRRQLRKIDVNKSFTLLDELVEKINSEEYVKSLMVYKDIIWSEEDSKQAGGNKPESTEYFKIQEGMYEYYRTVILNMVRTQCGDRMETLKWYRDTFRTGLSNVSRYLKYLFGNLHVIYVSWMYVDLCCHTIMQNVNQRLVVNPYLSHEDRTRKLRSLNDFIIQLAQKMEIHPIRIDCEEKREKNMFYFFAYYHMKDRFLQDTFMLKYLKEYCGDRQNVAEEYSLLAKDKRGNYFFHENLTQKDRYQYFTEGEEVGLRSFSSNIKNCEIGIAEFENRTGRKFKNKEIALKAFYREIYLDKTMYDRQQSKTIFNVFINRKVLKTSAYYFIDEKINMGMCRELGAIDEFWLKNSIQENLYYLVCKVLAELLPLYIISTFDEVLKELENKMEEVLGMFVRHPDFGGYIWLDL